MNVALKVQAVDAAAEIASMPLEKLDPARVDRFSNDTIWPVFERLRREDPVHFTPDSEYGPYWSVTKWDDIMAVDTNHEAFSSADGIALANLEGGVAPNRKKSWATFGAARASLRWMPPTTCRAAKRSARR